MVISATDSVVTIGNHRLNNETSLTKNRNSLSFSPPPQNCSARTKNWPRLERKQNGSAANTAIRCGSISTRSEMACCRRQEITWRKQSTRSEAKNNRNTIGLFELSRSNQTLFLWMTFRLSSKVRTSSEQKLSPARLAATAKQQLSVNFHSFVWTSNWVPVY